MFVWARHLAVVAQEVDLEVKLLPMILLLIMPNLSLLMTSLKELDKQWSIQVVALHALIPFLLLQQDRLETLPKFVDVKWRSL